ncbi:MAG: GNAT family N-acetyltransferase [Propioniciclava sp.]|uniref:GNAT family N-acetyltransferase n=1 Tax=Propioniciclava sp. TaxID=2038686 RepID=UPI0039E4AD4C
MTVGVATGADLAAIMALEACFEHARWSEASWAEQLANDQGRVLTARDPRGELCGVATFRCVAETADLDRIVVAPGLRGQGIGGRLLDAGLTWADAAGAEQVMLEVDAGNAPAIALYQGRGFVMLARRRDYYGTGRDALVMARTKEAAHE